jgi:outer membrane protein OmpA-like peptidoglycan-associated protein
MQRKTNRLLLLLIGTALAACSTQDQRGSSGLETEAEVVPSTVQPPPPEPEAIQYTEAELDVGDLGPVDESDETLSYAEEDIGDGDSGVSEPEEFAEAFPVTTYELPPDEEIGDLGPVDQSAESLSYEEEILDLGPVDQSAETDLSYEEEYIYEQRGTGVSAAEEYVIEEEVEDLGAVDTSDEILVFAEESVYQEESVGDVTTYESVTVNSEAQPLFAFDKADVRDNEQFKLESFVSDLSGAEFETVWVVGHADRIGSVEYNQGLSERRAGSVKEVLVRLGIDDYKVNAEGRSNLQPVTTEMECDGLRGSALIECYEADRRVEVSVSAEVVQEALN